MPASKFPEDRFVERSDAAPESVVIKRIETQGLGAGPERTASSR